MSDYVFFNSGNVIPIKKWTGPSAGAGSGNPKPHWWSKKTSTSAQNEGTTENGADDKTGDAASVFSEKTLVEPRNRQLEHWMARKAEREAKLAGQKVEELKEEKQ